MPEPPLPGDPVAAAYDEVAAAYDELPDGVLVTDPHGRLLRTNAAARRLLGLPAGSDPVGRLLPDVLPLADAAGRDWWDFLRPAGGLATRTRQVERTLRVASGPAAGRQLAVTVRFVRAADLQLVRLVLAVRDAGSGPPAERDRADLVSTVAHELRSPLTSIKGFTATLLAKWERFTDEQKRHMLATVNADADRVTRLISELLDVSRIEAGRLQLHRQVVDLPALVEQVFARQVAGGEPADRFVLDLAAGSDGSAGAELPELWLDQDKVLQVLGNLVENAVRHGAGTVTVTVAGYHGPAGARGVEVAVADEGDGVAAELLPRLFDRFAHGQHRASTGLGLFICRGIVAAHGGTVDVGRGPGGGARFQVRLPAGAPPYG